MGNAGESRSERGARFFLKLFDFFKFFIAQSEKMPDFVEDDFPDFFPDVFFLRRKLFDRFLVNNDHIRREIPIIWAPVLEWNAMVKPQD